MSAGEKPERGSLLLGVCVEEGWVKNVKSPAPNGLFRHRCWTDPSCPFTYVEIIHKNTAAAAVERQQQEEEETRPY